ncbi:energy transducer TonB [Pandoraea terrae]|uniref:Energy transducer TonB n=2 Tax=Pandoraea terrae TaxID=1537710 RepID=A0A5E4YJY4_9BURK|nr:energy transducer TonB [Pandoraea terrae]
MPLSNIKNTDGHRAHDGLKTRNLRGAGMRAATFAACGLALLLGACAITEEGPKGPLGIKLPPPAEAPPSALELYKLQLATRITETSGREVNPGRPQALLRSIVALEYWVDREGNISAVRVFRGNGDREAEKVAVTSLRRAGPFPPPNRALVDSSGRVRVVETWLFNNDGRFQLRSVASPQIGVE